VQNSSSLDNKVLVTMVSHDLRTPWRMRVPPWLGLLSSGGSTGTSLITSSVTISDTARCVLDRYTTRRPHGDHCARACVVKKGRVRQRVFVLCRERPYACLGFRYATKKVRVFLTTRIFARGKRKECMTHLIKVWRERNLFAHDFHTISCLRQCINLM
jgi:hypothetical protein